MAVSELVKSYNSFSGVDMKAVFASVVIAELQAISYSITREKAPIYTMGSPEPRAFARGKRGIAGTVIFVMFDRHALLGAIRGLPGMKFQSDIDDIRPADRAPGSDALILELTSGTGGAVPGSPIGGMPGVQQAESELGFVDSDQEAALCWYVDQIPPFDITLCAANEYGALAVMNIFGVEILNEGYGVSIDDLVSEQQMTYVARAISPWQWVRPSAYFEQRSTSL